MKSQDKKILAKIQKCMRAGEYLRAYDLAEEGLKLDERSHSFRYFSVLALARIGASEQALQRYDEYELRRVNEVDIAALEARIVKDIALSSQGEGRISHMLHAAALYESIFTKSELQDYYPAINAATTYYLGGNEPRSRILAKRVLKLCADGDVSYWSAASSAEASLLLGDTSGATEFLKVADSLSNNDLAAIASTRRQLSLLSNDKEVLGALNLPSIIHFAGHIISAEGESGRFPADQEEVVRQSIRVLLEDLNVGVGYGSLAAGADILFAEEILRRGGEIHLVLPFDKEDFIRISVETAGKDWVNRFENCWKKAASQSFSSEGGFEGDGTLFDYCSLSAMGRATLRHSHLGAPLAQIIAWDGKQTDVHYGTAKDRKMWTDMGFESYEIPIKNSPDFSPRNVASAEHEGSEVHKKELRAVIFGDVMGFSKLSDSHIPTFVEKVMGCLAMSIDAIDKDADEPSVLMANTWGDGLFIVCKDVVSAARCALGMQEAISGLDLSSDGFEQQAMLRLGVHFGPVFEFVDPVTKLTNFFGAHVNRTARIEPIAPPGEVYVTEEFASQLALEQSREFETLYVGQMPMAKNYGQLRMYLTRNRVNVDI